ncbi:MAG: 50S ribosomal protein L24 [Candidatus Magasanikbacteria bacterium]|jgi:large subunit ribosomal protein L24|nr:50S ribosomal protein L24 [Candidatus Magasanikbacteria bacterium]MBT4071387.1 50S ribosomal protein L24 [Candidatus Magasanikbacteria bacterium]
MKIKTGDNVKIISGKSKGKTGKVVQVMLHPRKNAHYVVIDGVNMRKKHIRSGRRGEGQVIELPGPIQISNVMLVDPKSGKPTRVGYKKEGNDKKRVAKVSGEFID